MKLQIVVGGSWHDFASFAHTASELAAEAGLEAHTSFDVTALGRLADLGCSAVLVYTCLDDATAVHHDPEHLASLVGWVRRGGALLALHSAAVAAAVHPELEQLLGGAFLSHPPPTRFRVFPVGEEHPITQSISAFDVTDEPYRLRCTGAERLHLVALNEERAHPLAWSRREGLGRVVYIALGHDSGVWQLAEFRKLLVQSLRWLTRPGS